MKPYNPDAICPKCGHTEVNTLHQPAIESWQRHRYGNDKRPLAEHMERRCQRCRHAWAEAPLGAKKGLEP